MATLLIEKKSSNVWLHTPSNFSPYIISQLYCKGNGDLFSVFEFSGVQRGEYHFSDISIKNGANPIESGFTSINQIMLRLEELKYVGFQFDGDFVAADFISSDPSNEIITGTDNKLFVPIHHNGYWNASTNTPSIINGTGHMGDYYTVSVAGSQNFGSGAIDFVIGDRVEYDGAIWFKAYNNNQSPVLTTNANITSLSLPTQDVSGFVSYINALPSSFSVSANEIRTYTITDTGQKFELLLRGRSFGGSEPDITASDVLELENNSNFNMYRSWLSHAASNINGGALLSLNAAAASITASGTASTAPKPGTSIYGCLVANNYLSAAPNGSNAGIKNTLNSDCFIREGVDATFIFANNDTASGCSTAVGLYSIFAAIPNLDPTNFTASTIMVGNDAGDTNLSFFINRTAATASFLKIPCGADFPAHSLTDAYSFRIQIPKTDIEANRYGILTITNIVTGKVFSSMVTGAQLPDSSTGLSVTVNRSNRNTGVATNFRHSKLTISRLLY